MLRLERGDTLVEVLFAVSVFSLVSVLGISIMNQATATSQRALQITIVRQEIDAQAEVLRFLNNSYVAAFRSGVLSYDINTPAGQWSRLNTQSSTFLTDSADSLKYEDTTACPAAVPARSFILNSKTAKLETSKYTPALTYPQISYDGSSNVAQAYGIWVQAIRSSGDVAGSGGYVDFYIKACWESPGQSIPIKDATIVRLYEPR